MWAGRVDGFRALFLRRQVVMGRVLVYAIGWGWRGWVLDSDIEGPDA
jgi:hypothetical protein